MRRMPDGSSRRIAELRLPDGGVLAHIVDVSEMVAKEEAIQAARRDAEQAQQEVARSRQRLEDAIEALPAGFELYDADDRLIMVNGMNVQMYPQLADLAEQRPTFEQVVRTNMERGGLPFLETPEELSAWVERDRTSAGIRPRWQSIRSPKAAGYASTSGARATVDWWPFASTSAS